MFRLLNAICQPFCGYISLTIIEPFQSIFPRAAKPTLKKPFVTRHPAPSVFRTIQRQRKMVSPEGHYVHVPNTTSVTELYLHRQAPQTANEERSSYPAGYLH